MDASILAGEELLPPGSQITLDNCHREPIGTPGGIQAHGALIAVTGPRREIVQRSENALEFFGSSEELLGSTLDALVGDADAAHLATPGWRRRGLETADGEHR